MRLKGRISGLLLLSIVLASCDSARTDEQKTFETRRVTYEASVLGGAERPLVLALPSDYEELTEPLPVLYLLHGWGGSEGNWTTSGGVIETLSAGYEEGDIRPMIVVMPNNVFEGANPLAGGPDRDVFLREIQEDIIPYIEANYSVSGDRSDRAIAGLSAGGIQTLNLTLFYPELWSYSFPMSTAYFPEDQTLMRNEYADDLDNPAINELVEFELAIAPDDFLFYQNYQDLQSLFEEIGIDFTTYEAPGGHTWAFWSHYFEVMAPKLFK